jgi:hypothetical protein
MILDLTILTAIIIGLTEALKRAFKIDKRFIPLVAVALSIFLGGTAGFWGLSSLNFIEAIVAGLTSVGLYSATKNTLNK